jgi:ABC-type transporter Mla subunit MlaD
MNAQDILENLAKLESNLQNIDSARKQVETLSNSYDATEKQLKNVASQITIIVTDLNNIFAAIKNNNELTKKDIDSKISSVIEALLTKVTGIQTEVDAIKTNFKTDCASISKKLNNSAEVSLDCIQNGVSEIITTLNKKANEEIEKLSKTILTFQSTAQTALNDYQVSMHSISSKFNDDIQGHVSSFNETKQGLDSVVETSKSQSQTLLENISQEFEKINKEIKEFDVKLNKKLDDNFTQLNTTIELNSTKLDEINSKISQEVANATDLFNKHESKQQQYIDSKFSSTAKEINDLGKNFNTISENLEKGINSNRKLMILMIIISLVSLLLSFSKNYKIICSYIF